MTKRLTGSLLIFILLILIFNSFNPVSAKSYPVKKMKFKNGLTVLLKRIPDSPAVSTCMIYRVGSRNERLGVTGISHLVEHMLFKGTKQYPKNKMGTLLNRIGAEFNGFASNDVTGFYHTTAPEYLELVLHIEADRMKNGLIGKNELNIEKKIILKEMSALRNKPSYVLWRQMLGSAFIHHPYMWPSQGNEEDIRNINSGQAKWYYFLHYKPKNAVLAVVGNFDEKKTIQLITKFFSKQVNKEPLKQPIVAEEPPQIGERTVELKNLGTVPLLHIAYHSPAIKDNDLYTLAVIDSILTGGRTSRLRKELVNKGLASSAGAWLDYNIDPGLYYLRFALKKDISHQQVEKAVYNELDKLKTQEVTQEELQKAKNHLKAQFIKARDSITHQSQYLAWYEGIYSYRYLSDYPRSIDRITSGDIMRVATKYFTRENRTVGRLYPKTTTGKNSTPADSKLMADLLDKADSESEKEVGLQSPYKISNLKKAVSIRNLENPDLEIESNFGYTNNESEPVLIAATKKRKYFKTTTKPKKKTTKKTTKKNPKAKQKPKPKPKPKKYSPPIPAPKAFNLKFTRHKLSNGIVLMMHENPMNPSVKILGVLRSGGMYEPKGKAGLSKITAYMIQRGSKDYPAAKFFEDLDFLGATMNFRSRLQTTEFEVWSLSEHFDQVVPKIAKVIKEPLFPEEQLKRVKNAMLSRLRVLNHKSSTISMKDFFSDVFPENHPFHHFRWGTRESIESITRDDVVNFYKTFYRPDTTIIAISGDIDSRKVIELFEKEFSGWKAEGELPNLIMPAANSFSKRETRINTMMDNSRVEIVMGHSSIPRTHPDYYKFHLMNYILGGGPLVTRLGRAIRDKGLAYSIKSKLNISIGEGPWAIQSSVDRHNVNRVIRDIIAQIRAMQSHPVTKGQLRDARYSLLGKLPVYLENNSNISKMLVNIEYYKLGDDYLKKYHKIYNSITREDIQAAAKKYLHPDKILTIITGPYK